jgi:hypothetical protein
LVDTDDEPVTTRSAAVAESPSAGKERVAADGAPAPFDSEST